MSVQTMEVRTSRSGLQKKIDVIQNDSGRTLRCIVSDMQIPESSNARIYAVKPSGAKIYNDCTIEKSTVFVSLTTQMLAEIGAVYCQIEITASGKTVTSFEFSIHVLKQLKDSTAIESTDEFTALEVALEEAKSLSHPEFDEPSSRQNLVSGESVQVLFGKIKRWFTDLGTSAFKGVSNVLTTTSDGYVLDARQGKALSDKIGNLSSLETTDKTSSVAAINELNRNLEDAKSKYPLYNTFIPNALSISDLRRGYVYAAGGTIGLPDGVSTGTREVYKISDSNLVIEIREHTPQVGRIWRRQYNGSAWAAPWTQV